MGSTAQNTNERHYRLFAHKAKIERPSYQKAGRQRNDERTPLLSDEKPAASPAKTISGWRDSIDGSSADGCVDGPRHDSARFGVDLGALEEYSICGAQHTRRPRSQQRAQSQASHAEDDEVVSPGTARPRDLEAGRRTMSPEGDDGAPRYHCYKLVIFGARRWSRTRPLSRSERVVPVLMVVIWVAFIWLLANALNLAK